MVTTTIEVIDTAVKIGLGGLITIVGTFVVAKLNHSHENSKERSKRYFDSLEAVSENVEITTHAALRYWALIIEWIRNNKQGMGLTDQRQDELEKTKSALFDCFRNLTVAESKLMLLGLDNSALLVRGYGEFIKDMRRQYYDGKKSLSEEEMDNVRKDLLSKRESLFKALSSDYNGGL